MKYAITGPAGRVFRVLDEANDQTVEITDEQAQTIADGEGAFFLIDGSLVTQQGAMAIRQAERRAIRLTEQFNADPEKAKALKRQEIALARYEAETAGFDLNGIPVRTDRQTQTTLTSALVFASQDPNLSVDWKLANGTFIQLDSPTIITMAQAVMNHVQTQFTKEKTLLASVEAATTAEELNAVNWI